MDSIPDSLEDAERQIRVRHLEQLSSLPLGHESRMDGELDGQPDGEALNQLIEWTKEQKKHIGSAVKDRVYGGPSGPLKWDNALFAFMESAATYLRDWSLVKEAARVYQSCEENYIDKALDLLERSEAEIRKLANIWGLDFRVICELNHQHPKANHKFVGPFCGAFYSRKDKEGAPFLGLAFKGTTFSNTGEDEVDYNYQLMEATAPFLYGSQVSTGAYTSLFTQFQSGVVPIDLISKAAGVLCSTIPNNTGKGVVTHVTGHSLGGSYSSLCFAELLRRAPGIPRIAMGDLYTYGSPRFCGNDLAKDVRDAIKGSPSSAWRIANHDDVVPEVPPFLLFSSDDVFVHYDVGWKIFPDQKPSLLETEIGTDPPEGPTSLKNSTTAHHTLAYYESLKQALNE